MPASGSTMHRRLAGGVQVDELVAPLPRIFAHQLVRDALLGEHQADLAREGAERELEQLPHGAAALARRGAVRLALRISRLRACWRSPARAPRRASLMPCIIAGSAAAIAFMLGLASSGRRRRSAAEARVRNRISARLESRTVRRLSAAVGSRPSSAASISPTGRSSKAWSAPASSSTSVSAIARIGKLRRDLGVAGSAGCAAGAARRRGDQQQRQWNATQTDTHRPDLRTMTRCLSATEHKRK